MVHLSEPIVISGRSTRSLHLSRILLDLVAFLASLLRDDDELMQIC